MKRYLSVYLNCSRGGMATVYYNRAKAHPEETHDLVFLHDKGGISIFDDLPNVNLRISGPGRIKGYIEHITRTFRYEEVRVTTTSDAIDAVSPVHNPKTVYEFHTPFREQMVRELARLDPAKIDTFAVPSRNSMRILSEVIPDGHLSKVEVRPNLLDVEYLHKEDGRETFNWNGDTPVLWIGRFDNQKNANDFLRVLAALPLNYRGVAVISLNDDGASFADFMGDVYAYNLQGRISVLLNLSKRQMKNVYKSVRDAGGVFLSTAVDESYGYTVAEAAALEVPTVAFEVGALPEHKSPLIRFIPVGDNVEASEAIINLQIERSSLPSLRLVSN